MNNDRQRLFHAERRAAALLPWALLTSAVTGITTHLAPGNAVWMQWGYLLHALSGAVLAPTLLIYVVLHFRRAGGQRRPSLVLTGLALAALLLALAASGTHTLLYGQSEALRWIGEWHARLAYAALALAAAHLHPPLADRLHGRTTAPAVIGRRPLAIGAAATALSLLAVTAATLAYHRLPSPYDDRAAVEPYQYRYGDHPFRPSQSETSIDGHFIDPRRVGNSPECGVCHEEIYRQWTASMHGQAAADPTYVTNVSLLAKTRGIDATRYCEGCHAPAALLGGQLTEGGHHAGESGTLANKEGVSCMGCHGITDTTHLKGVASYRFTPPTDYLFTGHDTPLARSLRNFLIRIHPEEHRAEMAPPLLAQAESCAPCHEQFMDKNMNQWGWVKMQNEYSSWLAGPYSGQSRHDFRQGEPSRCHDCHMPKEPGTDPSADTGGRIVSHRTPGANTALPALSGDREQLDHTRAFLQADRVRIAIDPPWREDATRTDLFVDERIRADRETPAFLYLGERARLKVTTSNIGVGHNFPGGTTDINQVWIHLRVEDAENRLVYESGDIGEGLRVDPGAHFYHSIPVDKEGKHVWRHDLFRLVGDSYRNVIPPGGADVAEYGFDVPYDAKGPLTVTAVLRYRKFNQRYAEWALDRPGVELPIVDLARHALTLPLRIKPDVEAR